MCNDTQFTNAGETKAVEIECSQEFNYEHMRNIWASKRLEEMNEFAIVGEAMLQGVHEKRYAILVQNRTIGPVILRRDTIVCISCELDT